MYWSGKSTFYKPKKMHKKEMGNTWDKALFQKNLRGGNEVRAWEDFDDYYNEIYQSVDTNEMIELPQQNDVKGGESDTFNQVPEVRKMVEDDVEKLAEEFKKQYSKVGITEEEVSAFVLGYNRAKETLYTEEQVRDIVLKFADESTFLRQGIAIRWIKNYFKSLKQPK